MEILKHLTTPDTPFRKTPNTKPDTMQRYTLNRTGETPATLTGVHLGTVSSSNAATPDRETSSKQWFTIDLYRTAAGTTVAHVQYRAGSKLGRETPVDCVESSRNAASLFDSIGEDDFVHGWPGEGSPDANRGRDFTSHHASVMQHGKQQLNEAVTAAMALLGTVPPPEEIV